MSLTKSSSVTTGSGSSSKVPQIKPVGDGMVGDKRIVQLETDILSLESVLAKLETDMQSTNQNIGNQLIEFSRTPTVVLEDEIGSLEKKEAEEQSSYYDKFHELATKRREWRKIFMSLLNTDMRIGSRGLSTSVKARPGENAFIETANNSKLLFKYDGYLSQSSREKKEEGFGPFELRPDEVFTIAEKQLGAGAFGVVHRGYCRGKEVAVKTLKNVQIDPKVVDEFKRECIVMRSLPHPNILLFLGACLVPGNFKLVTELATNGSLDKLISNKQVKVSFFRKLAMAREIAEGLNWLHRRDPPLLHLDLKPANILLTESWTIKIADFGMSRFKQKETVSDDDTEEVKPKRAVGGTPLYMPPEMFSADPVPSEKCDVYAYGILLWEFFSEKTPYDKKYKTFAQLATAVCSGERPEIPSGSLKSLAKLFRDCWDASSDRRPDLNQILTSAVFDNIMKESVSDGEGQIEKLTSQFVKGGGKVDNIDWKEFRAQFMKIMNVGDKERPAMLALKAILDVDENLGQVTLSNFQHFIKWFKPLRPCGSAGVSTLEEVYDIVRAEWFWGNMDSNDAATALRGSKSGTYLVRFSTRNEGQFTLSYTAKDPKTKQPIVQHLRIKQENEPFHTVLAKVCKLHKLKVALSGRPAKYASLFDEEATYTQLLTGNDGEDESDLSNFAWKDHSVIY
eukprot:TRINITY_DN429_c0_g1_i1.p1 TRINITY_DN429_c0_g1~~TRINITY_DN429_c0_g1_i1.p1  ORF type:complete len:680 (-),score=140.47 TRINITY_DN429_c0_g1_i1:111-2150(-)